MSKIHLEILDKERQKIFSLLSSFKEFGYLAGGTALALQIVHRESFDFDIFIKKPISMPLRKKVLDVFGEVKYYIDSKDQISFATKNGINITFLWYYFETLFQHIQSKSLPLASFKDIAADKAHTIGRRAVWRDYVDFFFLLKDWLSLEEIIELAKKKFKSEFNEILFLQQLAYFKDIERTPVKFYKRVISEKEIKSFLEAKVEIYTKTYLKRQ